MEPILEELIEKIKLDSKYRPTKEEIQRFKAEHQLEWKKAVRKANLEITPDDHGHFITDVILLSPDAWQRTLTLEKIAWHLAHGKTVEQISKKLKVTTKRIERVLASAKSAPSNKSPKKKATLKEVPYGWESLAGMLVPNEEEQWVLEKMTKDREANKSPDDIAKNLQRLGIKPKGGGIWFGKRILKTLELNQDLHAAWESGRPYILEAAREIRS